MRSVAYLMICVSAGRLLAAEDFSEKLQPFLEVHCYDCHADGSKKGGLDFDSLSRDLADPATFAKWEQVFLRVKAGEMPPKKVDVRPTADEASEALAVLSPVLREAHIATKGTVLRRLNRSEFEHTMNDIFGTRLDLSELLPADGLSHEFDNVGKSLGISMTHMQAYLDATRLVVTTATQRQLAPPAPKVTAGLLLNVNNPEFLGKNWKYLADGTVVRFTGDSYPFGLYDNTAIEKAGFYDIEITGYGYQTEEPIVCSIAAFAWNGPPEGKVFHYAAFPPNKPTTIKLRRWMVPNEMIKIEPQGLFFKWPPPESLDAYPGKGVVTQSVKVEGPFLGEFPSRGYSLIFGEMERRFIEPQDPSWKGEGWYVPEYETITTDEEATALAAIKRVAVRAWRRAVEDAELTKYLELFKAERADGNGFDDAICRAVTALFVSPNFLYLREDAGKLAEYPLASRLAYFLTRTAPDEELARLGEAGQLRANLGQQAERLIGGGTFERFINDFTDAWLDLRKIEDTAPDKTLYPEYDRFLHNSMISETRAFVTGREMGFSDAEEIDRVVAQTAGGGYRAGDLLRAVVSSEIFQTK